MTPLCRVVLCGGARAAILAGRLWQRMDGMQRAAFLWDVPEHADKGGLFARACLKADLAGAGMDAAGPAVMTWLNATGPGCRTAAIHFASACASGGLLLEYGREFLRLASHEYDSLIAMIPVHWRGARAYCRQLGFAEIGLFRKACRIARRGRACDGALLKLDLDRLPAPEPGCRQSACRGEDEKTVSAAGQRQDAHAPLP